MNCDISSNLSGQIFNVYFCILFSFYGCNICNTGFIIGCKFALELFIRATIFNFTVFWLCYQELIWGSPVVIQNKMMEIFQMSTVLSCSFTLIMSMSNHVGLVIGQDKPSELTILVYSGLCGWMSSFDCLNMLIII